MERLKVVAVEPERVPVEAEMTFTEIEQFVGGHVEQVALYADKVALVNGEARMKQLPTNRQMILQEKDFCSLTIYGNFVVVKTNEGKHEGLNEEELKEALFIYRRTGRDVTVFI